MLPYFLISLVYICLKICYLMDKTDLAQACVGICKPVGHAYHFRGEQSADIHFCKDR